MRAIDKIVAMLLVSIGTAVMVRGEEPVELVGDASPPPASTSIPVFLDPVESCRPSLCDRHGLEAGIEATFLSHEVDDFDNSLGSRLWLGYQVNSRWAFRTRFWATRFHAEQLEIFNLTGPGSPPQVLLGSSSTASQLDFLTLDNEFRRRGQWNDLNWETSLGIRYAERESELNDTVSVAEFSSDQLLLIADGGSSDLDAVGATFGVDLSTLLPFCRHLSLVASLRGSVLGGQLDTRGRVLGTVTSPVGSELSASSLADFSFATESDLAMWIGQAQVGLEYARSFHGRSAPEFFVRGLFETQSWSSSDYDLTIEGVTSEASLQDTFSGFTFGVGWRR